MAFNETALNANVGVKLRTLRLQRNVKQSDAARRIGDSRPFVLHARPAAESKRQLTVFESTTDEEYRQTLWAMAVQAGVIEQ